MSNTHPRTVRSRAAILDAAWELIGERGLSVSMAEIAEAVGMTRQSIYVHFKSRGGLLLALVRRADERERIHEHILRTLEFPVASERLDAFLEAWFDFVPKVLPVARQLIAAASQDVEVMEAWHDRMEDLRGGFLLLTRSLRREGALSTGWTAPLAADYLWAGASVQAWELLAIDRGWGARKTSAILRRTLAGAVLVLD